MPTTTLIDFLPGVGKRTAHLLHTMGVHTTGQLSSIPDGVLEHIFGPSIRQVQEFARKRGMPIDPADFSVVKRVMGKAEQPQEHHTVMEHISLWKKFQLAARVVSVL